jgi:hypothetical protein
MLVEGINTYDIALYAVKEKGYTIKSELSGAKGEILSWIATKGGVIISALTPLSLLALVVVFEQYGERWEQVETGNLYDELLEEE